VAPKYYVAAATDWRGELWPETKHTLNPTEQWFLQWVEQSVSSFQYEFTVKVVDLAEKNSPTSQLLMIH
jgi:hypothetical protein